MDIFKQDISQTEAETVIATSENNVASQPQSRWSLHPLSGFIEDQPHGDSVDACSGCRRSSRIVLSGERDQELLVREQGQSLCCP